MLRHFSSLRRLVYRYLFDQATRSGRCIEAFCGILALLSVVVIFIESSIGSDSNLTLDEWYLFIGVELFFTLMFTLEYILRVLSWPKPARYIFSFWGVIDLATTIPLYVLWLWPEFSVHYYFAWRSMRAIRVLRILKLLRYMPALQSLKRSIMNASHQLILFFSFIMVLMIASGAIMFGIEGKANGFTSLGASVYWAIVTVTTVGYGDIVPHTAFGRFLASLLILVGYSVIAIPTGILTAQMSQDLQRKERLRTCSRCHQQDHESDAHYCKTCGEHLPQTEQK
ncbi:ion transporter [Citrobacter sp. JGM124]|uniref:ion transporter n=1 Tax=Citrobacter sp. JGM124 TaxID=2799789 RepID=UPI001BA46494|nr:ion transporter [Citrobacter sp. JGM124]